MINEVLTQIYTLAVELRAEIFSVVITCAGYIINRIVYGPAKIKWAVEHEHHYRIPVIKNEIKDVVYVDTVAIFIQNTGRSQANDVSVIFNYAPRIYDIVPAKQFSTYRNPDERFVITFDLVRPREYVSIRLIEIKPSEIPLIVGVTHRNGPGIMVPMHPQQVFSRPFLLLCGSMFYIGIVACIYIFILILRFIIK